MMQSLQASSEVTAFMHNVMMKCDTCSSAIQVERSRKDPDARGQPVSRVHVDYTVNSGPARLHAALPHEADSLSQTPFAVIQVSMLPANWQHL